MYRTSTFFLLLVLISLKTLAQHEVMFSNNYPPFNYTNEKGELEGFNIDILNAIIQLYHSDIKIKGDNWTAINNALENGEIQAIGGTHYPGSVDNNHIYTRSAINTSHCFFYNKNFHKKFSLELLRSTKKPVVALWKNDVLIHYILSINPSTEFVYVNGYSELLNSLEQEDITCIIAQRIGGMYFANKLNRDYVRASHHRILERGMGFKVSKEHPELAQILNNGLEVILSNGEYQRIYTKWLKEYDKDRNDWHNYLKYVVLGGILIAVLLLLLIFLNQFLHVQVRKKTKDLQHQLDLNSQIMQELEREKLKAEESEKMKSAFLANMSHEIRTPMNGILGFTELLASNDFPQEERQQFIDVIQQSGNRMLNTINNILDVSKLESGAERMFIAKVDVKQMLDELHSFFILEAKAKNIDLPIEAIGNTFNGIFLSDEYKLNSILTNLIKNAIKFTKSGFVKIEYMISQDQAEFIISDSGIGIAQEKQDAIFHQFVQADSSRASGFEGSGLGLSITQGYIKLLGGSIRLESVHGEGSRFFITIPNAQKTEVRKV